MAVSDDVDALVAQLKLTQAERRAAEARVAELEGVELDIRASHDQIEKLKATWTEWSELLGAHDVKTLPDGNYGAALARSILRKILVSPIVVRPVVAPSAPIDLQALCAGEAPHDIKFVTSWTFRGLSRFDALISGGLAKGDVTVDVPWDSPDLLRCIGIDKDYNGLHPRNGPPNCLSEGANAPPSDSPASDRSSRPE